MSAAAMTSSPNTSPQSSKPLLLVSTWAFNFKGRTHRASDLTRLPSERILSAMHVRPGFLAVGLILLWSTLLREDEERRLQSGLEELWIRLDGTSRAVGHRHARFVGGLAVGVQRALE